MQEPEKTPPEALKPESQTPATGRRSFASTSLHLRTQSELEADHAKPFLKPQEAQQLLEQVRESCVTASSPARPLEEMLEELSRSGYKQETASILRHALESPEVRPEVGALWMRRILNRRSWDRRYPEGMDELCERGEVGRRAVIEFVEVASAARKPELVRRALRKHGHWLRQHPVGWGAVAQSLARLRCYGRLRRWMADWREKPELDLPLLHCLVAGLRGSGRNTQAKEVIELALARHGTERAVQPLKLWSAMDEALAGHTEAAFALFKDLASADWDQDTFNRYYLVRGMIRVQKAKGGSRAEAFASACERVKDHFRRPPIHKRDVLVRREYRQCMCRMARDAGYLPGYVRAAWRSAESWALIVPLLLVPGLQLFLPLYLVRLCTNRRGKR